MNKVLIVLALVIGLFLVIFLSQKAGATAVVKITWCHVEPNGNQETLELPSQALQNAGHMDAQGNPLHAGDHLGACVEPSVTPSVTPEVTPEITPEATPSAEPTQEPSNNGGPGDGLGCSTHDCSTPVNQNSPYDNSPVGWK